MKKGVRLRPLILLSLLLTFYWQQHIESVALDKKHRTGGKQREEDEGILIYFVLFTISNCNLICLFNCDSTISLLFFSYFLFCVLLLGIWDPFNTNVPFHDLATPDWTNLQGQATKMAATPQGQQAFQQGKELLFGAAAKMQAPDATLTISKATSGGSTASKQQSSSAPIPPRPVREQWAPWKCMLFFVCDVVFYSFNSMEVESVN